jgi:hypothetical protein
VPSFDDPHRGQRPETSADGGTTDLDLKRELAFRGQAVARLELPGLNEALDVSDDAFGGQGVVDWRATGTRCRR